MATRELDPLRLDVQAFAKDAAEVSGHWPVRMFERLAPSTHADAPPAAADEVVWSACGEQRSARGTPAQNWLHLKATTQVRLECQRCLEPVEAPLGIDRWFRFVAGEDAAAQMDADSEEDVLALPRALNLRDLLEDELLLALPLVPLHEVCPAPLGALGDAPDVVRDRPNPFAALAALKRGGALN